MYSAPSAATIGWHDAGVATVTRPGARPQRADGRQVRGAGLAARARRRRARGRSRPCARRRARGGTSGAHALARQQLDARPVERLDDVGGNADVGDDEVAGQQSSAGGSTSGSFGAAERDGERRLDARADRPRACRPTGRSAGRRPRPGCRMRVDVGDDRLEQARQRRLQARCRRARRRSASQPRDLRRVQLPLPARRRSRRPAGRGGRESRGSRARRRGRRRARPSTKTDTSTPRCRSVRATTKPSPPLLPRPQSTATRRSSRSVEGRLHGRHHLAAGVLHQHERRDADLLDRAADRPRASVPPSGFSYAVTAS